MKGGEKTNHLLAQEIFLQWAFPLFVVLQSDVAVRAECAREDCYVSKYGFSVRRGGGGDRSSGREGKGRDIQRLVKDIRHLVFEILRCD